MEPGETHNCSKPEKCKCPDYCELCVGTVVPSAVIEENSLPLHGDPAQTSDKAIIAYK